MNFVLRAALVGLALVSLARASDYSYVDISGQPQSIEQYIGSGDWVVVEIWATTCTICERNAHHMVEFDRRYQNKNVKVIGISADGKVRVDAARDFVSRHNISFLTLLDDASNTTQFFEKSLGDVWPGVTPTYLLFDPEGEAVGYNFGPIKPEMLEKLITKLGGNLG